MAQTLADQRLPLRTVYRPIAGLGLSVLAGGLEESVGKQDQLRRIGKSPVKHLACIKSFQKVSYCEYSNSNSRGDEPR